MVIFYTIGFTHQKGVDKLIKVFNEVKNRNWKLFIIGHLPYIHRPFISRVSAEIKPKNRKNIIMTGLISDNQFEKILQISDCYVSLSLTEACQLSVIEALESQIPVYSTNIGIIPDLIKRKVENVITLSYNDLEKTKKALNSFINKTINISDNILETKDVKILPDWSVVATRILNFFWKIYYS